MPIAPIAQPIWSFFSRRSEPKATATELYGRVVAWARAPWFYGDLGVPDTPEGQLEMILLHMTLILHRLKTEGPPAEPLARAVAETFVTDMDDCLREMGVGDMTVAKKVKKAAAALFDRARDYGAALREPDNAALAKLIGEHMLPDATVGRDAAAARLAAYARASSQQLAGLDAAALRAGGYELAGPQ